MACDVTCGRDVPYAEWQARLAALSREIEEMRPGAAGADAADGDARRAVASVEGRLHLEQERHTQQLERLQMEFLRIQVRRPACRAARRRASAGRNWNGNRSVLRQRKLRLAVWPISVLDGFTGGRGG